MLNIRYSNRKVLQGILLAIGDQKIRVAIKDSDDVAEYRLISNRWVSEDCEVVVIDVEADSVVLQGQELPENLLTGMLERPVVSRIM
ncbi:MAG: hypothetical protein JST11_21170 [Acidobacteria bacterium]|nr:hypothetical protein [Acidobacteriota bacterium]